VASFVVALLDVFAPLSGVCAVNARQILTEHGLEAKKSWGQNFLIDDNVISRIAAAIARDEQTPVVEIGAGLGALTGALATRCSRLIAVERDTDLVPILDKTFATQQTVEIVAADALALDHHAQAERLGGPFVLCGNLPYQITSPLIFAALHAGAQAVSRAIFMVQKEFADRARAQPGSKTYGRLSVTVQQHAEARTLFSVSPGCFHPRPRVTSAIIELTPRPNLRAPVADKSLFSAVVKAAFATRRKMLRNSIQAAFSQAGLAALSHAGVKAEARPEMLAVEEFAAIANALHALGIAAPASETA